MDGQVNEQEINDMFTKVTAAFDYIKQTFVNANQFAEQVRVLQSQVTQLTQDFEQLKVHNHALDEAINALTQERDTARRESNDWQAKANAAESARAQAQSDADHWYNQHQSMSQELATTKEALSAREHDLQEALEGNAQLKAKLETVEAQINQIYQGFAPKPVVEEVEKHEGDQPRDPNTQRWQSWSQTG